MIKVKIVKPKHEPAHNLAGNPIKDNKYKMQTLDETEKGMDQPESPGGLYVESIIEGLEEGVTIPWENPGESA